MRIDRQKFFTGFRQRIDATIEQEQVDGLEFLLARFEADSYAIPQIAYFLATAFHETAGSFQPVEEGYYLGKKAKAFQKTLRYYPYFGRGYVQLTHKSNSEKATRELRRQLPELVADFEESTGKTFDLVKNPEQALNPLIAYACLTLGMTQGWYGRKLGDFITSKKTDYVQARRSVNVMDKAGLIAGYATSFEKILRLSAASLPATADQPTAENLAPSPTPEQQTEPVVDSTPIKTVTMAMPTLKRAWQWLGSLSGFGFLGTTYAALNGMPTWAVLLIGLLAGAALVGLVVVVINHKNKIAPVLANIAQINADPTTNNIEVVK